MVFIAFTAVAAAQNANPTPTPAVGDVVKISTNLIQIDVTVTDKKGKVVSDLRPDEIEVYENGKKQEISNFSFVSGVKVGDSKTRANISTQMPPNELRPEGVRRTIALVVDDLTLSFASSYWVKDSLKRFVNEQMQEGDLVAIIRTGAGIGALQQFTNDKRMLLAAADKVRWNMSGTGRIGNFAPMEPSLKEQVDAADVPGQNEADRAFEQEADDFRQSAFATGSLGAVGYVVRGMSELPGRKSVIMLSDGFRLFLRDSKGNAKSSRVTDALKGLVDQANRASVVIYTIDARGLIAPGPGADDDSFGMSGESIERTLTERLNTISDTQAGLTFLARQTGGLAMINQNDINHGIRRVLDDQSYYLVGYEPNDETFDPKTRRFNSLSIKVSRPGVNVRYRSGFFGIAEEQIRKPKKDGLSTIFNALTSPFGSNEITLRLSSLFVGGAKNAMFLRSYLHVDAGNLTFTPAADGNFNAKFDLVAINFGDNGAIVDELAKNHEVTLKADAYEKVRKEGFVYLFTFPVKKSGGYQMRVAIRDAASNKVGSASEFIEIPTLKNDRLTLSGVVFETVPAAQQAETTTDPLMDTSLRQFESGRVVRFGYEIYDAKLDAAKKPNLIVQVRLFRDGNIFYEGTDLQLAGDRNPDNGAVTATGSFRLTDSFSPGNYVLQLVVTDKLRKGKRRVATRFVPFEVSE